MNKMEKGCTFGLVLQQKVNNQAKNMEEGFKRVLKELSSIKEDMKNLTEEVMERPSKQSTRQLNMLMWACGGLIGIVTTLVGVMIYGARV